MTFFLIVLVNTPTSVLKSPDKDSGLSSDENNAKGIVILIVCF